MSKEGSPVGASNVPSAREEQAPTGTLSSAPGTTTPTVSNDLPTLVSPAVRETMTSSVAPSSTAVPTKCETKGKRRESSVEKEWDSGPKIEKTEKLTNNNWTAWKKKIAAVLQAHGLYEVVTGGDEQPPADRPNEKRDWLKRDRIAYATLMANLANDQTVHAHPGTETSAALWQNLHLVHETRGQQSIAAIRRELHSCKADEGTNIPHHITKLQELQGQLYEMGDVISDPQFQAILLSSLPTSWDSYTAGFIGRSHSQMTKISTQEIISLLRLEWDHCTREGTTETSYRAKSGKTKKRKAEALDSGALPCDICGLTNHKTSECRHKGKPPEVPT